jgi:hypothetical protein
VIIFLRQRQFEAKRVLVPPGSGYRELIVGDDQRVPLDWREVSHANDGNFSHPEFLCGE